MNPILLPDIALIVVGLLIVGVVIKLLMKGIKFVVLLGILVALGVAVSVALK